MFESNDYKKRNILILVSTIFVFVMLFIGLFLLMPKKNDNVVDENPERSYEVAAYDGTFFSISAATAEKIINVSAGNGYRNSAASYISGAAMDVTLYKVIFSDYVNPFEAYE